MLDCLAQFFDLGVPAADMGLGFRQLIFTGVEKVVEHAEEVEVHV